MTNTVYKYDSRCFLEYELYQGHLIVNVDIKRAATISYDAKFLFDTGSVLSTISSITAKKAGILLTGKTDVRIGGFNMDQEKTAGEIVTVPFIYMANFLIYDVQFFVAPPGAQIAEVLGNNVLTYFNYTVSNHAKRIYFAKNPQPTPYANYGCGQVLMIDEGNDP